MNELKNKSVMIIGLGLMGGAIAMGLRKENPDSISAFDIDAEVIQRALDEGVIDWGESTDDAVGQMLHEADLVISCLYPQRTIDFFDAHMEDFKKNALITDITGVKGILVQELIPKLRPDLDFIMGHPMAGSEKEGYGGADEHIFENHNYILVTRKNNSVENIEFLKKVIYGLGFNNIVETTPELHDQKIAFTSQLCHVIACALIDSEKDLHITDFEGGSFCDLTRIAMINANMWPELFITNKEALLAQIDKFEASMADLRKMIADSDKKDLTERLSNVRKKRIKMEIERKNRVKRNRNLIKS